MAVNRLSLAEAAQIPLPSSPGLQSPRDRSHNGRFSPNPLRRCSSSMSSDRRPSSPSLRRKASTSSLRNGEAPPSPHPTIRRASSTQYLSFPLATAMEEHAVTAESIAAAHFQQELANHAREDISSNTVVILHDACYGHRFAKPSTKRAAEQALEYTFERPERIEATTMGVAAAYVFLGERHAEGEHAPHPKRAPPAALPFKIRKTTRTLPLQSPAVTAVHGTKWMTELSQMCGLAAEKLPFGKELERIKEVGSKMPDKEQLHTGDLYLCAESLAAFEGALGGVCDGVDAVFTGSASGSGPHRAFVAIRPPGHHCSANMPSGFCWLNNVHVGIEYAARTHGLTHAAILDFDLHHGDGSQAITWARNNNSLEAMIPSESARNQELKPRNYTENFPIGYYSIHDIDSYPCETHNPVAVANASLCIDNHHGQSIWNVHLEDWRTEAEFWSKYERSYSILIDKMRNFLRYHTTEINKQFNEQSKQQAKKAERSKPRTIPSPKAAIFISAGFDASEHEVPLMQRHGKNVITEFYARITKDIVALAAEAGTAVDGRIISVLEGGYSNKALMSGAFSHLSGLCDDREPIRARTQSPSTFGSLGVDLANHFEKMRIKEEDPFESKPGTTSGTKYDATWWTFANLTVMERLLQPKDEALPAIQVTKTARSGSYSDATKASAAKKVDPAKVHRTASWSSSRSRTSMSTSPSRPATPPPPDVDWITAVHELSKLLVPADRQIKSFTPDELSGGVRPKKARHTTIGLPSAEDVALITEPGRQLRDRKSKVPAYESFKDPKKNGATGSPDKEQLKSRVVSNSDRRKTIGDVSTLSSDQNGKPSRRRSSIASTVSTGSTVASVPPLGNVHNRKPSGSAPSDTVKVVVKKTRGENTAPRRATAVKVSNPPPVPRVPSGLRNTPSSALATTKPSPPSTSDKSIDDLSNGLKRIKINVPSNEEYAARQQAKKAAEKPPVSRAAVGKPATAKATTTAGKKPALKGKEKTTSISTSPSTVAPAPSASTNVDTTPTPSTTAEHAIAGQTSTPLSTTQALCTPPPHPSVPALQFHHEYPLSEASHILAPFNAGTKQLNWQTPNQDVPDVSGGASGSEVPSKASSPKPHASAEHSAKGSPNVAPAANVNDAKSTPGVLAPAGQSKGIPQWSSSGFIPFAQVDIVSGDHAATASSAALNAPQQQQEREQEKNAVGREDPPAGLVN